MSATSTESMGSDHTANITKSKITDNVALMAEIEENPMLAFSVIEYQTSAGRFFQIVKHERVTQRGEDQYGRWKGVDEKITISFFDSQEQMEEHQIGMAESVDDVYSFEMLASGEVPELVQEGIRNEA